MTYWVKNLNLVWSLINEDNKCDDFDFTVVNIPYLT